MLENWRVDIYSNVWKIIKWKVAQNKDMKLLRPFSDATHTGIQFAFTSSWVKQASEKKGKQNPQQSGGWQHATNEKQMCVRPWPMVWRPTRDQCVIGERLEEEGCVAADGRVEGVNSVAVNSLNWEDVTGRKVAAFRGCIIVKHVCASEQVTG